MFILEKYLDQKSFRKIENEISMHLHASNICKIVPETISAFWLYDINQNANHYNI